MTNYYRNKTYVAGAWDEDQDAISQLYEWNDNDKYSLEFKNIHDFHQSRDTSLPCNIKKNLSNRMDNCNMFILIVGPKTNSVTRGSCFHCTEYNYCKNSDTASISNKSFVAFECDKARVEYDNHKIAILVLYNSSYVNKEYCPESLRDVGCHIAMKTPVNDWNKFEIFLYYNLSKNFLV